MDFDPGFLLLSVIFSGIGFVYFTYGRKQSKIPTLILGIVMMVYPYFLDSKLWLVAWGIVLSLIPRFL